MERFHIIDSAEVILKGKRGIFKQAKIYRRGRDIYVGISGGYVRLYNWGDTGNPDLRWDDIDIPGCDKDALKFDHFGKLTLPENFE